MGPRPLQRRGGGGQGVVRQGPAPGGAGAAQSWLLCSGSGCSSLTGSPAPTEFKMCLANTSLLICLFLAVSPVF